MQELFSALSLWLSAHPLITGWYTAIARLLFPVLSALILVRAIRSLLRIPHTPEVWAQLSLPGGGSIPLTHWENILGRGKSADAILNYPSISRQHAALCRGEDGAWTVYDLGSKGGTAVNGTPVTEQAPLKLGDTLTLGGVPLVFLPQTVGEREELEKKRQAERPAAMWPSFLWLTVFQILTAIQLTLAAGEKASPVIPICFLTLTVVMWLYAAALRLGRCVGFELETIAFYLSTLSLAVTASSAPGSLPKQLLAIVLGMGLPTTANYIIMASLTAPILVQLASGIVVHGVALAVPLIAAHLYCFYFGILADDTPPVGLAAYAAAAIADTSPIATGIQGFLYDIRTAILPLMFIFNHDIILWGVDSVPEGIFLFFMTVLGCMSFASLTQGWFIAKNTLPDALLLACSTIIMLYPALLTGFFLPHDQRYWGYLIGIGIMGLLAYMQHARTTQTTEAAA